MASGGDGAGFQVRQFKSALSVGLGCRRQEGGSFMSSKLNPSEFPNDSSRLDLLSSSMDDELGLDDADQMLAIWHQDAGARAAWHAYHLIGDVLRSEDLAAAPAHDEVFLQALRGRLTREPVPIKPGQPVAGRSAGWWLMPGAMAACLVAGAGCWAVYRAIDPGRQADRPQLVQRAPAAGERVRNAGLDRYLEAHRTLANGVVAVGGSQYRVHTVSDIQ